MLGRSSGFHAVILLPMDIVGHPPGFGHTMPQYVNVHISPPSPGHGRLAGAFRMVSPSLLLFYRQSATIPVSFIEKVFSALGSV